MKQAIISGGRGYGKTAAFIRSVDAELLKALPPGSFVKYDHGLSRFECIYDHRENRWTFGDTIHECLERAVKIVAAEAELGEAMKKIHDPKEKFL